MGKRLSIIGLTFLILVNLIFNQPNSAHAAGAGLAWGPVKVGNLEFFVTNVHTGYAGPKFPNAPHTNFHVGKRNSGKYRDIVNYHIVKYSKGKSHCVYIWDSVTKKTVMDSCGDSWSSIANKAASAMKSFTKTLLNNADWIATIAIWATIAVIVVDLIVAGGAVVVAASPPKNDDVSPKDDTDPYDPIKYITEPQPSGDVPDLSKD